MLKAGRGVCKTRQLEDNLEIVFVGGAVGGRHIGARPARVTDAAVRLIDFLPRVSHRSRASF